MESRPLHVGGRRMVDVVGRGGNDIHPLWVIAISDGGGRWRGEIRRSEIGWLRVGLTDGVVLGK